MHAPASTKTLVIGFALGGLVACTQSSVVAESKNGENAMVAQNGVPVISAINPAAGNAGPAYPISAVITGTGFTPTNNTVFFGPISIDGLRGNGNQIEFSVPKERPSTGEVPPLVLPPGDYSVVVKNRNGTSNAIVFTLTP